MPIWLAHHSIVLLPIITSRGVKYTHNDINDTVLHPDSGPTRICVISQASTQEVIVVGDGGAKHRSMAPPTEPHNVADPHAVAKVDTVDGYPRAEGLDPTTTPSWAYGVIIIIKAFYFGKDSLRMAGIVQMLHAHRTPYDKYLLNAHRERTLTTRARDQARTSSSMASAIPGSCRTTRGVVAYH